MQVFGILLGIATLLLIFYTLFYKELIKPARLRKLYEHDMENKVRWIAVKSTTGRDEELFEYIMQEQYKLNVEDEFCIDFSSEKDFVCEILEAHRQRVIESFFYNSLKKEKSIYNLNSVEYYMLSLQGFLEENLLKEFNGKDMYKCLESGTHKCTYEFTNNATIYVKLYYIVTLFCATNESVKLVFNVNYKLNNAKTILRNKKMTVIR